METLRFLTSNYLIDVAFVAWLSAQVLKTLLYYLDTNTFRAERLVGSGGMPSAHSALVCSIAVGMSRKMGFCLPGIRLSPHLGRHRDVRCHGGYAGRQGAGQSPSTK